MPPNDQTDEDVIIVADKAEDADKVETSPKKRKRGPGRPRKSKPKPAQPEIPDHLLCNISRELFRVPYITDAGHAYERRHILKWFDGQNERKEDLRDPKTNAKVSGFLRPNWGLRQAVQAFLDDNPDFIPDGWETRMLPIFEPDIYTLVSNGDIDSIKLLWEDHRPLDLNKTFFLNLPRMQAEKKIGYEQENETLLHTASWFGHQSTVDFLLDKGADIDIHTSKYNKTALHLAAKKAHKDVVKLLLDNGACVMRKTCSIYEYGRTALHFAVCRGNSSSGRTIVEMLIKEGADVNAQDNQHFTPLHYVATNWKTSANVAQLLLDKGANIEARTKDHSTPIMSAAASRSDKSGVSFFIEKGANYEAQDKKGLTPLHHAALNGLSANLRLLLEKGANIDSQDMKGCTPLHHAARKEGTGRIKVLLDNGANIKMLDNEGNTPLHYAATHKNTECIQLLIDRGADIEADIDALDAPALKSCYLALLKKQKESTEEAETID